jgi:uncharacterized Tic20 family protein
MKNDSIPEVILDKEEKTWARRAHLSTLLSYPLSFLPVFFPWVMLGNVVSPFIHFLSRKKGSYSAKQALEAVYLQSILAFIIWGVYSKFSGDRLLLVMGIGFAFAFHLILLSIAVFKTTLGKEHHYPFSFFPALFSNKQTVENWKIIKGKLTNAADFTEFKSMIEKLDSFQSALKTELNYFVDSDLRSLGLEFENQLNEVRKRLAEEPNRYRQAKQFLQYFPETTLKVVESYNKLGFSKQSLPLEEEGLKRRENLKSLLESLNQTSKQVNQKLMSEEAFHLDIEINALKKNVEYGGYT